MKKKIINECCIDIIKKVLLMTTCVIWNITKMNIKKINIFNFYF